MNEYHPAAAPVEEWYVGFPAAEVGLRDGVIALTAADLADSARDSAPRLGLHEAMAASGLPQAGSVRVRLPDFRGKSVIRLLSWLVTERLATADAEVSWYQEKRQGPGSTATLLTGLGWRKVAKRRDGKVYCVSGLPPAQAELPAAGRFRVGIGGHELSFAADYGVFSPSRIDDGTRLLAEVALRHPPVSVVADIGIGYGPLAIALVRNELALQAVGTDVDCLALWLAERNAADNNVTLRTACTPDPGGIEDTPLTVCNVPTHLDRTRSTELMSALAQRARGGRALMIVVHASLEARYVRHLADAGLTVTRHPGEAHVVLAATG